MQRSFDQFIQKYLKANTVNLIYFGRFGECKKIIGGGDNIVRVRKGGSRSSVIGLRTHV